MPKLFWAALLVVLAFFIVPLAGAPPHTNPNELARIEFSLALALWAQLDLTPTARVYGLSEDVARREDRIYSDKAPGLSFFAVPAVWIANPLLPRQGITDLPAYWPLRHLLTLVLVALPSVFLAFLIASVDGGEGGQRIASYAFIVALATPLWTYSSVFFGHAPAAVLVTLSWILLLRPGASDSLSDSRAAVLGGVAAGLAVTTEYPAALLAAVIFTTLAVRRTPIRILALAIAGALLGVLPALVYHQLAFGAPWVTGYAFKADSDFQAIHTSGFLGIGWPTDEALWGILFSAKRGLFFSSPVLLLAPIGLWRTLRYRGWRDAGPLVAAISVYVFFAAGFVDWEAGWCAAARHLMPVVPLVAMLTVFALDFLFKRTWTSCLAAVLIGISGAHTLLSIALTPFFPPQFENPLVNLVVPSLIDGALAPNLLSAVSGMTPQTTLLIISAAVIATLGWAVFHLAQFRRPWMPFLLAISTVIGASALAWQASNATADQEIMRAQMLRYLGHSSVADEIERNHPTHSPD